MKNDRPVRDIVVAFAGAAGLCWLFLGDDIKELRNEHIIQDVLIAAQNDELSKMESLIEGNPQIFEDSKQVWTVYSDVRDIALEKDSPEILQAYSEATGRETNSAIIGTISVFHSLGESEALSEYVTDETIGRVFFEMQSPEGYGSGYCKLGAIFNNGSVAAIENARQHIEMFPYPENVEELAIEQRNMRPFHPSCAVG